MKFKILRNDTGKSLCGILESMPIIVMNSLGVKGLRFFELEI